MEMKEQKTKREKSYKKSSAVQDLETKGLLKGGK